MTTTTLTRKTTSHAAKSANVNEQEQAVTPYVPVDELVSQFHGADSAGVEAQSVFDAAAVTIANTRVIKSRVLYLLATHDDVMNTTKARNNGENLTGALRILGKNVKNRSSFLPLFEAGKALATKGLVTDVDVSPAALDVVHDSFEAGIRAASKKAREEAKAAKIALELAATTPPPAPAADVPSPVQGETSAPSAPTPAEVRTKSAVETEGTLSVTESAPSTGTASAPVVDLPGTAISNLATAIMDVTLLADQDEFTTAQLEQIELLLSDLAARVAH